MTAASAPITVVLVDDHTLVREGLRRALAEEGIEVIGEAGDGEGGIAVVVDTEPDVVLMDISMPGLDGIEATRRLRRHAPDVAVVVLTMHADEQLVGTARAAGAVGFLVKDATTSEVANAVRGAVEGRHILSLRSPSVAPVVDPDPRASTAVPAPPTDLLTPRQLELLQLLAEGCSTREVADRLDIAPKTVRNHLTKVYDALDVGSRSQAVVEGLRRGLVDLG